MGMGCVLLLPCSGQVGFHRVPLSTGVAEAPAAATGSPHTDLLRSYEALRQRRSTDDLVMSALLSPSQSAASLPRYWPEGFPTPGSTAVPGITGAPVSTQPAVLSGNSMQASTAAASSAGTGAASVSTAQPATQPHKQQLQHGQSKGKGATVGKYSLRAGRGNAAATAGSTPARTAAGAQNETMLQPDTKAPRDTSTAPQLARGTVPTGTGQRIQPAAGRGVQGIPAGTGKPNVANANKSTGQPVKQSAGKAHGAAANQQDSHRKGIMQSSTARGAGVKASNSAGAKASGASASNNAGAKASKRKSKPAAGVGRPKVANPPLQLEVTGAAMTLSPSHTRSPGRMVSQQQAHAMPGSVSQFVPTGSMMLDGEPPGGDAGTSANARQQARGQSSNTTAGYAARPQVVTRGLSGFSSPASSIDFTPSQVSGQQQRPAGHSAASPSSNSNRIARLQRLKELRGGTARKLTMDDGAARAAAAPEALGSEASALIDLLQDAVLPNQGTAGGMHASAAAEQQPAFSSDAGPSHSPHHRAHPMLNAFDHHSSNDSNMDPGSPAATTYTASDGEHDSMQGHTLLHAYHYQYQQRQHPHHHLPPEPPWVGAQSSFETSHLSAEPSSQVTDTTLTAMSSNYSMQGLHGPATSPLRATQPIVNGAREGPESRLQQQQQQQAAGQESKGVCYYQAGASSAPLEQHVLLPANAASQQPLALNSAVATLQPAATSSQPPQKVSIEVQTDNGSLTDMPPAAPGITQAEGSSTAAQQCGAQSEMARSHVLQDSSSATVHVQEISQCSLPAAEPQQATPQGDGDVANDAGTLVGTGKKLHMAELVRRFREEPPAPRGQRAGGPAATGTHQHPAAMPHPAVEVASKDQNQVHNQKVQGPNATHALTAPAGPAAVEVATPECSSSQAAHASPVKDAFKAAAQGSMDDDNMAQVDAVAAALLARSRALLRERDAIQNRIQAALGRFKAPPSSTAITSPRSHAFERASTMINSGLSTSGPTAMLTSESHLGAPGAVATSGYGAGAPAASTRAAKLESESLSKQGTEGVADSRRAMAAAPSSSTGMPPETMTADGSAAGAAKAAATRSSAWPGDGFDLKAYLQQSDGSAIDVSGARYKQSNEPQLPGSAHREPAGTHASKAPGSRLQELRAGLAAATSTYTQRNVIEAGTTVPQLTSAANTNQSWRQRLRALLQEMEGAKEPPLVSQAALSFAALQNPPGDILKQAPSALPQAATFQQPAYKAPTTTSDHDGSSVGKPMAQGALSSVPATLLAAVQAAAAATDVSQAAGASAASSATGAAADSAAAAADTSVAAADSAAAGYANAAPAALVAAAAPDAELDDILKKLATRFGYAQAPGLHTTAVATALHTDDEQALSPAKQVDRVIDQQAAEPSLAAPEVAELPAGATAAATVLGVNTVMVGAAQALQSAVLSAASGAKVQVAAVATGTTGALERRGFLQAAQGGDGTSEVQSQTGEATQPPEELSAFEVGLAMLPHVRTHLHPHAPPHLYTLPNIHHHVHTAAALVALPSASDRATAERYNVGDSMALECSPSPDVTPCASRVSSPRRLLFPAAASDSAPTDSATATSGSATRSSSLDGSTAAGGSTAASTAGATAGSSPAAARSPAQAWSSPLESTPGPLFAAAAGSPGDSLGSAGSGSERGLPARAAQLGPGLTRLLGGWDFRSPRASVDSDRSYLSATQVAHVVSFTVTSMLFADSPASSTDMPSSPAGQVPGRGTPGSPARHTPRNTSPLNTVAGLTAGYDSPFTTPGTVPCKGQDSDENSLYTRETEAGVTQAPVAVAASSPSHTDSAPAARDAQSSTGLLEITSASEPLEQAAGGAGSVQLLLPGTDSIHTSNIVAPASPACSSSSRSPITAIISAESRSEQAIAGRVEAQQLADSIVAPASEHGSHGLMLKTERSSHGLGLDTEHSSHGLGLDTEHSSHGLGSRSPEHAPAASTSEFSVGPSSDMVALQCDSPTPSGEPSMQPMSETVELPMHSQTPSGEPSMQPSSETVASQLGTTTPSDKRPSSETEELHVLSVGPSVPEAQPSAVRYDHSTLSTQASEISAEPGALLMNFEAASDVDSQGLGEATGTTPQHNADPAEPQAAVSGPAALVSEFDADSAQSVASLHQLASTSAPAAEHNTVTVCMAPTESGMFAEAHRLQQSASDESTEQSAELSSNAPPETASAIHVLATEQTEYTPRASKSSTAMADTGAVHEQPRSQSSASTATGQEFSAAHSAPPESEVSSRPALGTQQQPEVLCQLASVKSSISATHQEETPASFVTETTVADPSTSLNCDARTNANADALTGHAATAGQVSAWADMHTHAHHREDVGSAVVESSSSSVHPMQQSPSMTQLHRQPTDTELGVHPAVGSPMRSQTDVHIHASHRDDVESITALELPKHSSDVLQPSTHQAHSKESAPLSSTAHAAFNQASAWADVHVHSGHRDDRETETNHSSMLQAAASGAAEATQFEGGSDTELKMSKQPWASSDQGEKTQINVGAGLQHSSTHNNTAAAGAAQASEKLLSLALAPQLPAAQALLFTPPVVVELAESKEHHVCMPVAGAFYVLEAQQQQQLQQLELKHAHDMCIADVSDSSAAIFVTDAICLDEAHIGSHELMAAGQRGSGTQTCAHSSLQHEEVGFLAHRPASALQYPDACASEHGAQCKECTNSQSHCSARAVPTNMQHCTQATPPGMQHNPGATPPGLQHNSGATPPGMQHNSGATPPDMQHRARAAADERLLHTSQDPNTRTSMSQPLQSAEDLMIQLLSCDRSQVAPCGQSQVMPQDHNGVQHRAPQSALDGTALTAAVRQGDECGHVSQADVAVDVDMVQQLQLKISTCMAQLRDLQHKLQG